MPRIIPGFWCEQLEKKKKWSCCELNRRKKLSYEFCFGYVRFRMPTQYPGGGM